MGNIFNRKSHMKKLTTYPLDPKISRDELGTSPFVLVKERPLAVTAHVNLYLRDTLELHGEPRNQGERRGSALFLQCRNCDSLAVVVVA